MTYRLHVIRASAWMWLNDQAFRWLGAGLCRPRDMAQWWRTGHHWDDAARMGWPVRALADRFGNGAALRADQDAEDDAHVYDLGRQEWESLTDAERADHLARLRFRLVCDADRVWLTALERFMLDHVLTEA